MIMQLKDTLGVYKPLDVFEDFDIKYNHAFEDYKSISGKVMPYTSKFKIPLTQNNRNLCGVVFDVSYPSVRSIEGRMLYTDGTVAFYFIADIEGETINVLQPYIELTVIDKISKAIKDLNKWKLSDLFDGETINFATDNWFFGNHTDLNASGKTFFFPFLNFTNKASTFAYDSMRDLNQLQPTFVINKLIDKIFNYVGLTINSLFLKSDDQLDTGLKAEELGLMIPLKFRTIDNDIVQTYGSFVNCGPPLISNPSDYWVGGFYERLIGIPNTNRASNRLMPDNFTGGTPITNCRKLNYDWESEIVSNGTTNPARNGGKFCSTVNGKMKISGSTMNPVEKPFFLLGRVCSSEAQVDSFYITDAGALPYPQLDVYMVDADMLETWNFFLGDYIPSEESSSYDMNSGFKCGVADYVGLQDNQIKYEVTWDATFEGFIDVKANQDIQLAIVYKLPESVGTFTQRVSGTNNISGGAVVFDITFSSDGTFIQDFVSTTGIYSDSEYDQYTHLWYMPDKSIFQILYTFDFLEHTDIPSGFVGQGGGVVSIVNCDIDLGESFKQVKDYSLLEVIKMIMQRFNLQFYTDSSGLIWIDSEENRKSTDIVIIDYLIDESIDVNFTHNDNGILTIKDTSPSFYDKSFNTLEKYEVSPTKRDEVTLNFNTCVFNGKMFDDVYDDTAYDLLKFKNDTDYWGTSNRTQVDASALKPMFCFLKEGETTVFFPFNACSNSDWLYSLDEAGEEQIDFGFYNIFKRTWQSSKVVKMMADFVSSTSMTLVSFKDYKYSADTNNLYKITWYKTIMDKLNDESVIMDTDIYISEDTFKKLIDYPIIKYKGMEWEFKGFDDYPLSAQNGGMTKIKLIKKSDWVYGID